MRSEKKQTVINLVAKTISYGTTMAISFLLTPYLVSRLGKEAYSFYPMANNFTNYMGVITIALNSMASRFITISLTKGDREKANQYFFSILVANIILSAVLLLPLTAIVVWLDKILRIPLDIVLQVKVLFALVFISMMVNLLTNVLGVAVFSQNRLDLGSICDITVGILRVVLYLVLFLCFRPSLIFVGVVALAVAIVTVGIQYVFTKKLLPFIKYSWKYYNGKAVKEVISSGVWNSVNQIGTVLLSTIGLMLCNILYGASEAGDYSIALTIPQFINGIVSMLSSVFLPGLTIKFARGNKNEVIQHVHVAQETMGMLINIPVAVFMVIGVNFFKLWTPSVDPYKLQRLSILAIGYLLVTSVMWPVSNMNTVMNRVKVPALVMLGTGIVNVVLIYVLYHFTNLGVYSIPLCQLILFIMNRAFFVGVYSAKCLNEKWSIFYTVLIKSLLGTGVIFGISYMVNQIWNPQGWISLILECAVLGVIGLGVNMLILFGPTMCKENIKKIIHKIRA